MQFPCLFILVEDGQSLQARSLIQVRVSGAHLDRLVAGEFLDDLQTNPSLGHLEQNVCLRSCQRKW